jgi:hypothetical protein
LLNDDDLTDEERRQIEIEGEELGLPGPRDADEPDQPVERDEAEEPDEIPMPTLAFDAIWHANSGSSSKRAVMNLAEKIARLELQTWADNVRKSGD